MIVLSIKRKGQIVNLCCIYLVKIFKALLIFFLYLTTLLTYMQ